MDSMLKDILAVIGLLISIFGATYLCGYFASESAYIWVKARRQWGKIAYAEKMICEYRDNRELFMKWKETQNECKEST